MQYIDDALRLGDVDGREAVDRRLVHEVRAGIVLVHRDRERRVRVHLHEPVAGHLDLARGIGQRVEHVGALGLDGVALVEHDVRARREIA